MYFASCKSNDFWPPMIHFFKRKHLSKIFYVVTMIFNFSLYVYIDINTPQKEQQLRLE